MDLSKALQFLDLPTDEGKCGSPLLTLAWVLSEQLDPLLLAEALQGLMGCLVSAFKLKPGSPVSGLTADNDSPNTEVHSQRTTPGTKRKHWQALTS